MWTTIGRLCQAIKGGGNEALSFWKHCGHSEYGMLQKHLGYVTSVWSPRLTAYKRTEIAYIQFHRSKTQVNFAPVSVEFNKVTYSAVLMLAAACDDGAIYKSLWLQMMKKMMAINIKQSNYRNRCSSVHRSFCGEKWRHSIGLSI